MAVDIQKLFNEELLAALVKYSGRGQADRREVPDQRDGRGRRQWLIDLSDSGPKLSSGNPGNADVTISLSSEDFQKLHENPQANSMQLFFAGKLKVTGNQMLAMKLPKLFQLNAG